MEIFRTTTNQCQSCTSPVPSLSVTDISSGWSPLVLTLVCFFSIPPFYVLHFASMHVSFDLSSSFLLSATSSPSLLPLDNVIQSPPFPFDTVTLTSAARRACYPHDLNRGAGGANIPKETEIIKTNIITRSISAIPNSGPCKTLVIFAWSAATRAANAQGQTRELACRGNCFYSSCWRLET